MLRKYRFFSYKNIIRQGLKLLFCTIPRFSSARFPNCKTFTFVYVTYLIRLNRMDSRDICGICLEKRDIMRLMSCTHGVCPTCSKKLGEFCPKCKRRIMRIAPLYVADPREAEERHFNIVQFLMAEVRTALAMNEESRNNVGQVLKCVEERRKDLNELHFMARRLAIRK